jgi:hypothetical protein
MRMTVAFSVSVRILLVLAAASVLGVQPAAAKPPSCLRGKADLVAVSGPVIVVRTPHRPFDKTSPNDTDLLSCWKPTGRRGVIARLYAGGQGTYSGTPHVTIVDGRYVGTTVEYGGGDALFVEAYVTDARTGKRRHTTANACEGETGGVHDAVFLPKGGLAFACTDDVKVDRLYLFRTGATRAAKVIDRSEAFRIGQLAVSADRRLYWTVDSNGDRSSYTVKSLQL